MTTNEKHIGDENGMVLHEIHYTHTKDGLVYIINGVTIKGDNSALCDYLLTLEKGGVIFESQQILLPARIEIIETIFIEHGFFLVQFWVPVSNQSELEKRRDPLLTKNGKINALSPVLIKEHEDLMRHLIEQFPSWQPPPRELDRSIKLKEQSERNNQGQTREKRSQGQPQSSKQGN